MNTSLFMRVNECIARKKEGESWDFKREWHHEKNSLLHDIICMSNLICEEDGIIIIGVDEENGYEIHDVSGDTNRRNTQQLVDFLREKRFAGGSRPEVEIETVQVDAGELDVIVVKNTNMSPYYL